MSNFYQKLGITLLLVGCIVVVVAFSAREALRSSVVYGTALQEVEKRFGAARANLNIPLFAPLTYADGESNGIARFVLCAAQGDCYQINANKYANNWEIEVNKK